MPRSTRKTEKAARRAKDNEIDNDQWYCTNGLTVCNQPGIKFTDDWISRTYAERSLQTYFITPQQMPISVALCRSLADRNSKLKLNEFDFGKFWAALSDVHKERRLIADYMAALSTIQTSSVLFPNDWEKKQLVRNRIGNFFHVIRSEIMIDKDGPLDTRSYLFLKDQRYGWQKNFLPLSAQSLENDFANKIELRDAVEYYRSIADILLTIGLDFVFETYFDWVSLNMENLKLYIDPSRVRHFAPSMTQADLLKKLHVTTPRWSKDERAELLRVIEDPFGTSNDRYLERMVIILRSVQKFKFVVFGKEKFCAHCNRSSHIGVDRLWTCKRCDQEGLRPRARYCNKECQRADWRRHKADKHSGSEESTDDKILVGK